METIAVTGASGQLGGRVARRLVAAGETVRLLGRDTARLPDLETAVKAPAAVYRNAEAMREALEGADTLFLVSGHEDPDRVGDHVIATDAAIAAGVTRLVYVSFLGAAPDATFTFARDHWHTEQHIKSTGIRYTFLRNSFYQAGLAAMTGSDGVLRGPAGNGAVSTVGHDDIAEVATAVLTSQGHDGQTYDVTGPEALTMTEVAGILSRFADRPITYQHETTQEAYASRAAWGAADWEVAGWVTSYQAIANGELDAVSDTVLRLTGHPARSLSDFLIAYPASYRHLLE